MKQQLALKSLSLWPKQTEQRISEERINAPCNMTLGALVATLSLALALTCAGCAAGGPKSVQSQASREQRVAATAKNDATESSVSTPNRALASLVVSMGPPTTISLSESGRPMQKTWNPAESEERHLAAVKDILEKGANPNALHVLGFYPTMGWDSSSSAGATSSFAMAGSKGKLVEPDQGGQSLLEFCQKYGLSRTAALLQEHGAK